MINKLNKLEKLNIKEFLELGNTMIVCDTNVYLNIYNFAPGYCDFAIKCMGIIKQYLIVPYIVKNEFQNHQKQCYNKTRKKLKNTKEDCEKPLNTAKAKIMSQCMNLKRMQFPDADDLLSDLTDKIDEQFAILENFFEERKDTLNLVSEKWEKNNFVNDLMKDLNSNRQVLKPFSNFKFNCLCIKGKNRYKHSVPPGYKDKKKKDGKSKYYDFIWWSQILQYAKKEKKNIVIVTDDVKIDWWNKKNDGTYEFRKELIDEFHKVAKTEIFPFTSKSFYEKVAEDYGLEIPDLVEYALEITNEDYCNRISDDVFDSIEFSLIDNGMDYIDESTTHIGDLGIDEFVIENWEFIHGEQYDRKEDEVQYILEYDITLSSNSFNYSGRDEDTKEIYLSPGSYHVFEGTIEVLVTRTADIFLDFKNECSFDETEILSGSLTETLYVPCMDELEEYDEYNVDVEVKAQGETFIINKRKDSYTTCSICSAPLSILNDYGGVCDKCYEKYDI